MAAGTYTLTARATDNLGGVTTSAVVHDHGQRVQHRAEREHHLTGRRRDLHWKPTITITATASDSDGNVTRVEFRDGTTVLGQDTSAPYSFTWRNVPPGSHVLTARATDNRGAATTSGGVGIVVLRKR